LEKEAQGFDKEKKKLLREIEKQKIEFEYRIEGLSKMNLMKINEIKA
jgi:hypothetical protein